MKAYKHLVKHALAQGNTISVNDGGDEWEVVKSTAYKAIIECIESVSESTVAIHGKDGATLGVAFVLSDLDDDETVADYSDNDYMNNWWEKYEETV